MADWAPPSAEGRGCTVVQGGETLSTRRHSLPSHPDILAAQAVGDVPMRPFSTADRLEAGFRQGPNEGVPGVETGLMMDAKAKIESLSGVPFSRKACVGPLILEVVYS